MKSFSHTIILHSTFHSVVNGQNGSNFFLDGILIWAQRKRMCTACHCWCTCQAVVLLILTVVQNVGLLFGLTKLFSDQSKTKLVITVIFVVVAMCHFECCSR